MVLECTRSTLTSDGYKESSQTGQRNDDSHNHLPISCRNFGLASFQFRSDVVSLATCRRLVLVGGSFPEAVFSLATIRSLAA